MTFKTDITFYTKGEEGGKIGSPGIHVEVTLTHTTKNQRKKRTTGLQNIIS